MEETSGGYAGGRRISEMSVRYVTIPFAAPHLKAAQGRTTKQASPEFEAEPQ
jgi:hypothetical protein